ncbi:DUF2218 domain-containing protein [Microbaculum marinum]|uniref:DUF2218 domain-containing protein n=1 Tax=Microbaculum marinum TaxID=1764581 RepID=A0AAW9REK0_9HYPH
MIVSRSNVRTDHASKYLMQLSKHWKHRFPELTFDAGHAEIPLPAGPCTLEAGDGVLEMTLETETAEGAERMENVVADHLKRFAFREQLDIEWTRQET